MLLRPIKWAFSIVASVVMLWVFFFVPIGSRTLFDHVKRIAGTPEARDLGHDIQRAGEQVYDRARTELREGFATGDGGHDAGAREVTAGHGVPPVGSAAPPRRASIGAHPRP